MLRVKTPWANESLAHWPMIFLAGLLSLITCLRVGLCPDRGMASLGQYHHIAPVVLPSQSWGMVNSTVAVEFRSTLLTNTSRAFRS